MNNVLRMGKRVFTVSVVVTTIAWSIGLAALLVPLAAGAASLTSGDLIKGSLPAVYYYGADGKRYVFPNEKTYKTWYSDFSSVKKITDAELAAISIGGNVTYKPGVKMVKITTDPKVYAVDAGGALRWINSETVAGALYGGLWAKSVEDIPDAFFVNYKTGADIAVASEFVKATVTAAAPSINVDKGLATGEGAAAGTGALSIAAAAANFPASAIVASPVTTGQSVGQRRAPVLKVAFAAGSADVKVKTLKFKRGGISKDGDVDNVFLAEGKNVFAEAQSVSDGVAVLTEATALFTVSANTTKVIDVLMDVNRAMSSGSTINWSLASADVTSDAATVSGSAVGNTMTTAVVTDLGALKVDHVSYPSSVDPGTLNKEMWRVTFEARSQDMLLTYAKFNNLGSSYDSDITNIKLMDGATQLNGVVAQIKDKVVEFDLSGMTGGGYKILAGASKQLTLVGDIVAGTNRTFQWSIQKEQDIRATDLEYNVQAFVDSGTAGTFAVEKATLATTINYGSLSVGLAADSPNTNISDGGTNLTLAKYNFKATGEDVKVTALTVLCYGTVTSDVLLNTLIKLDSVQVGTTDATMTCGGATDVATYSFGNSFIVPADGKNHSVEIVGDLTSSLWDADETIYVGFGGTATAQGKSSLQSITPSNVNGHTLTLKGAAVTAMMDASFTDRSASFPTGVANAQNVKVASFVIIAGAGEASDVSQIILGDNTTYQGAEDFQNLVLKDRNGTQIGTTISALNANDSAGAGTYTFTPATAIRLAAGEQKAFDLYADVKGSITNASAAINVFEIDDITATGVVTATSANYSPDTHIALQKVYLALHGNLTVDESSDTTIAQQLVLGSTGVELAKFKLSASAVEDITVTKIIVEDDMTTGFANSARELATGSLKNFKLYNGSTLLASVSSLDETYNTLSPYATFSGFTLTVPKNQNVTLTVKADVASYDDGGKPSSTHRIFIAPDYKTSNGYATQDDAVVAVGAGSGMSMSKLALDINGGTASSDVDQNVFGNYMDLVRAKLTLAFAADTPSGATSAGTEQTVAKFVATNSANVGNYSLTISKMNFTVSSSGNSITGSTAASALNVYKDSVSTANLLVTTNYGAYTVPSGYTQGYYWDSTLGDLTTSLEVAAGASKTIVVTLNTSAGGFTSAKTLSVGIAANDLKWVDGGTTGSAATATYYTCDSLPLAGKTLVF